MLVLGSLFILIHCLTGTYAGTCFHCVSPDSHLDPTLRRQLKTQTDVFFWQIGTQWNACSQEVNPINPSIEGQICSKYDMCITLQPNVNGTTFVVRGCLENVLRHNWREDRRLHRPGCYMVRSMPMYPNKQVVDYVICVCRGDYCNGGQPAAFVEEQVDFSRDSILRLASKDSISDALESATMVILPLLAVVNSILYII